ncbi:MAG: flagellar export chaperone FlgN [Clostridiaceae bacterium]|nr:flagellar export chaperone FlgN [Clostridiaceae bacterium]
MKAEETVDYLFRISQGKLKLVKDLLVLTKQQGEVLEAEEVKRLEALLSKKQELMDKIDLLDREFVEKYGLLKEALGIEDFKDLQHQKVHGLKDLQQRIQEIVTIMKEIQDINNINTSKMKESISQTKDKFKSMKTGKKAVASYTRQYKRSPSIYIDKKK